MPQNVKSFYSNETVKSRFLQDTIEEVEQEDVDAADFVLSGPSNAGNVTDEEEEDDENRKKKNKKNQIQKRRKAKVEKQSSETPVVIEDVTSEKVS